MIEMKMDGRCALVTGGSKGIGYAAAMNFVKAGGHVAIVARRPDVLEEACRELQGHSKGKVVGIPGDVSKAEDCARVFANAEKELGQIDVLLNNAGTHSNGPFEAATDALAAGLRPQAFLSHPAVPAGVSRDEGAQVGAHHQNT
jgi:3-oxoacyl-[acyl-carrier protein] reductase